MSQNSNREVLLKKRERYVGRGRKGRSKLIDEVCALCGYERKHAVKVLNGKLAIAGGEPRRGGAQRQYGKAEREVLKTIWLAAEQPCGKRLHAALGLWLPYYEAERGARLIEIVEGAVGGGFQSARLRGARWRLRKPTSPRQVFQSARPRGARSLGEIG